MPGELPIGTLYTYAVDITVDEAEAAGATRVDFDEPVSLSIDNFLGFPVGTPVPVGYYDREVAAWLPNETQGLIVGVVDVVDGLARVDVDGDADADVDDDALAAARGLDDADRSELALRPGSGGSAMWTQVRHFTPFDLNWGPGDIDENEPDDPNEDDDDDREEFCEGGASSIISCHDGSLIEMLDVAGVGGPLVRDSQQALGYVDGRSIEIPVTGASVPDDLVAVEVVTEVAGQRRVERFESPSPGTTTSVVWDGNDAFGRPVVGAVPVTVTATSLHRTTYSTGPFGAPPDASSAPTPVSARELTPVEREWRGQVTARTRPGGETVGGWTFPAHHRYDPVDNSLYLGDGTEVTSRSIERHDTLWRLTGAGDGDVGSRALETSPEVGAVAIAADGTTYLAEPGRHRVLAITPSGELRLLAGSGAPGDTGDGGPATSATLSAPRALAVDALGGVLVADAGAARVRRIDPDGTISAFAGTGSFGSAGDGGPATSAQLGEPRSLSVTPDGTVLIADGGSGLVRAVRDDGTISTYAGGGASVDCPGGCTGDALSLGDLTDVAVSTDGARVALVSGGVVHELDIGGRFRTIGGDLPLEIRQAAYDGAALWLGGAGYLRRSPSGAVSSPNVNTDGGGGRPVGSLGGAAAGSRVDIADLAVSPGGEIVLADAYADAAGSEGEGEGEAHAGGFDGVMVLSEANSAASSALPPHGAAPGASALGVGAEFAVPSSDGARIFLFDASGRHLRTVASDTLVIEWTFTYDAAGALIGMTDAAGRTTTIERIAGTPTAVVGHFGQRTALTVDEGLISASAGPLGRSRTFSYDGGLLVGHTDEAGNPASYGYDADGRLVDAVASDGTTFELAHTELENGRESVLLTGGLDQRTTRAEIDTFTGEQSVETTLPDGSTSLSARSIDGSGVVTDPNGDSRSVQVDSDPRFGGAAKFPSSVVQSRGGFAYSDQSGASLTLEVEAASLGDPFSTTRVERTVTTWSGGTTSTVIDPVARTITATDPTGLTTTAVYDERGLITDLDHNDDSADSTMTYDGDGLLTSLSAGSRTVSTSYGPDGRPDSVIAAGGQQRTMDFDEVGRLTSISDAMGSTTTYGFNTLGQMTGWGSPEGVTHTATSTPKGQSLTRGGPPDPIVARTYDAARHPSTITHGDGTTTAITFNGGKAVAADGPERDLSITYGTTGGTSATPSIQSSTWESEENRTTVTTDMRGGVPLSAEWTYFNGNVRSAAVGWQWSDLQLTRRRIDSSNIVDFGYDQARRLVQAGPYSIVRDGPGRSPSAITDGTSVLGLAIDPYGSIAGRNLTVGGEQVVDLEMSRDDNGRVASQSLVLEGADPIVADYARNDGGFVTEWRDGDGDLVESYEFDRDGNRTLLTREDDAGEAVTLASTYVDGVIDSLEETRIADGEPTASEVTVVADANGMVTELRDMALDHAVSGELLEVEIAGQSVRYGYDLRGRRVARDVDGSVTMFVYGDPTAPGRVTDTVAPDGAVTQYLYDDAGLIHAVKVDGEWYSVVVDSVGSPVAVVDSTGTVVDQRSWSPWGELLDDSNPGFDLELGYAGGIEDPTTGLVRFGVREYDPVTAMWLSPDPIGIGGGSSNLYRYADGDPVSNRDLSGTVSVAVGAYRIIGGDVEWHSTPDAYTICVSVGSGWGVVAEGDPTTYTAVPGTGTEGGAEFSLGPFEFDVPLGPDAGPCSTPFDNLDVTDLNDVADWLADLAGDPKGALKGSVSGTIKQKFCYQLW
ncbi:MAG: RHS repeat-associated core domain-containing protein [Microthrixaceae bacterium]